MSGSVTPPAQRVQYLLGRDEEFDDEDHQAHAMFCEMEELRPSGEDGEKEWKETARYTLSTTVACSVCLVSVVTRSSS